MPEADHVTKLVHHHVLVFTAITDRNLCLSVLVSNEARPTSAEDEKSRERNEYFG
jgi:hypothetical protein